MLILQRYYFESESQLKEYSKMLFIGCCLSYKDTILKANHSAENVISCLKQAVAYPTKILFWKRITAAKCVDRFSTKLLLILQRYYFESESQQTSGAKVAPLCCCLSYKDTILKANHSCANLKEIIFPLLLILQRYYFESESQPIAINNLSAVGCCLSYKDTILKANHSWEWNPNTVLSAVAYPTKILFWKRITASYWKSKFYIALLLILQRYYFESESQRCRQRFIN